MLSDRFIVNVSNEFKIVQSMILSQFSYIIMYETYKTL